MNFNVVPTFDRASPSPPAALDVDVAPIRPAEMDTVQRPKQAACLICRKGKIKCEFNSGESVRCKRCQQLDVECVRPIIHAGRQKGIKNKRKGLDKAIFQIERALKRAKSGEQSAEDSKALFDLQHLFAGNGKPGVSPSAGSGKHRGTAEEEETSEEDEDELEETNGSNGTYMPPRREGGLEVDDAENPLQLLARASNLQLTTSPQDSTSPGKALKGRGRKHNHSDLTSEEASAQLWFTSIRVNLDVGDDIDPILMGLTTEDEADELFDYFHRELAHTRWGLDPDVYTASFTRSRSAYLFTSILAASALFRPQDAALSRRLSAHAQMLGHRVVKEGHKSVEIILGFMVNVPWMFPGQHSTDDRAAWHLAMATTIAIDLSVHKLLIADDAPLGSAAAVARGDCLDPRTALAMDGFNDVDPASDYGRRLLRRRERCWLALFVLERGMCLARGRSFTVPVTRSLRDCDTWHQSDIALPMDAHMVSMAVLRRDLDGIFATVRGMCDVSLPSDGSMVAESVQSTIERFFDQWNADWRRCIGSGPDHTLPPYVEILMTHTRLSIYSGVINHPTAPVQVRQFFRTAGMASALLVMRVAIKGESGLKSMPNNTAIMITFAACFALTLSAHASAGSSLASGVRALIYETADMLERVGKVTTHRNGLSAMYGKYLRVIARRAALAADNAPAPAADKLPDGNSINAVLDTPVDPQLHHTSVPNGGVTLPTMDVTQLEPAYHAVSAPDLWPGAEALQFSTMSDEQIVDFLNQPYNAFDPAAAILTWQDLDYFEGVSWPSMPGYNFG